MKSIFDHALEFNHKKNVTDLNLLDVLNSFDELISKSGKFDLDIEGYDLSNESNTKLYRKVLQIQRENTKDNQKGDNNPYGTNGSSLSSTLNRKV